MTVQPGRYETRQARIMVNPPSVRVETIPAKYETQTQRVVVKEAGTRVEIIPGKYEWVEDPKVVKSSWSFRPNTRPARNV